MTHPTFAHPVFEQLYERDYFIDDAVLREILALGPAVAVPELLKMIDATLENFQTGKLADTDWLSNYNLYHALYLLHDLQAPEALDVYRRMLYLDSDSTEFWFGDALFDEVPELLAHAGQTRLPELLALLEDQKMSLKSRLVVSNALSQLVRMQPGLRPAISEFLQRYLRYIIAHASEVAQLLPASEGDVYGYGVEDYLGLLLADMQDAELRELEPEMRELHRLNLVDETIAGGPDNLDFKEPYAPPPSPDIFTRHQRMRELPDNYSPFHPDAAAIAVRRAEQEAKYEKLRREQARKQPRPVLAKIGRNDPCPCGSGQKYKKCHGA